MRKVIFILFIFINFYSLFSQGEKNICLGIPKPKNKTKYEYIINRPQYTVSYSSELNSANWVSWYVSTDYYGSVKRYSGNFITDTTLPSTFDTIKYSDYTNSGYDRGHLVRSEERTKTAGDNKATFILSNIIPQTPDLNRGVWLSFENYCKKLCFDKNKQLFIIAGGKYSKPNKIKKINNKIAVPDSCWKVVLVLDKNKGISKIDSKTEIIAVMIPNIDGIKNDDWIKYITTSRKIEKSAGYNFFPKISKKIQNIIENKKYISYKK